MSTRAPRPDPLRYLRTIHRNMMARCYRKTCPSYPYYGGATPPVTVCPEWHSFEGFKTGVLRSIGPRPVGLRHDGRSAFEFDRFPDPTGPYQPGNVRWALGIVNQQNKRRRKKSDATPKRPRKRKSIYDPYSETTLPWYLVNSNGTLMFNPGTSGR